MYAFVVDLVWTFVGCVSWRWESLLTHMRFVISVNECSRGILWRDGMERKLGGSDLFVKVDGAQGGKDGRGQV